jgi:hypothetical protein
MLYRSIALALLPLCALGCASTETLEKRPLPFHVVVVPMADPVVGDITPGELPGEQTELTLAMNKDALTSAVGSALQEYCFSRVTVLDADELDATADAFERHRLIIANARAVNADLIVELGLRYDQQIHRDTSSTFWLNYPLFLFLGPSNWFMNDNGYFADVELTASIYDLNVIEAGAFDIGDAAARVVTSSSRYSGTELSFVKRADGAGDYLLGIVWPSGHLAHESPDIVEDVQKSIVEQLRAQAVQGIQSRRGDLVQADWIAPMFVDPGEVSLRREGDVVVVSGNVRLRKGGLVGRVQAVTLSAGPERVRVTPTSSDAESTDAIEVATFEGRIHAPEPGYLRLECEAGARDRFFRTYTYSIPGR